MATATAEPIATPPPAKSSFDHVLERPEQGAGVFFPSVSQGVSLQLGALGILLALLWAFEAQIVNPAGLTFMLPMALSLGAVGIFAGGLINLRNGVTIAGVIGCLYGVFWMSFGLLLLVESGPLTKTLGAVEFAHILSLYLWIWTIVSACLGVATWFVNKSVFAQQAVLTFVFLFLAIGYASAPGGSGMLKLGGWLSLVDAALAMFVAMALVINETSGKDIVPVP